MVPARAATPNSTQQIPIAWTGDAQRRPRDHPRAENTAMRTFGGILLVAAFSSAFVIADPRGVGRGTYIVSPPDD